MGPLTFHKEVGIVLRKLEISCGIKYTEEAQDLLTMVAMHESAGLKYTTQVGGGPARGFLQMEGRTHNDIFVNYLRYRQKMLSAVLEFAKDASKVFFDGMEIPNAEYLVDHHRYAIAMARIHFYRVPEGLPKKNSPNYLTKLSEYCKLYYNGPGKATSEKYLEDYKRYYLSKAS